MHLPGWMIRLVGPVISAVRKPVVSLLKQRNAESRLTDRGPPGAEAALESALVVLGVEPHKHPWWKLALTQIQAQIVRPEIFSQPSAREWLNDLEVRNDLKHYVLAEYIGHLPPAGLKLKLVSSYANATYEETPQSDFAVSLAIAFLRVSLELSLADPNAAEIVREGTRAAEAGFVRVEAKLDTIKDHIEKRAAPQSPVVSQFADTELQRILRRRFCPGQDVARELEDLYDEFATGSKYEAAENAVKGHVSLWLARVAASKVDENTAEKWRAEAAKLDVVAPQEVAAVLKFAHGAIDAAIRCAREIETGQGRAMLLYLLAKSGRKDAAAAHFKTVPLTASLFSPHGWRQYLGLLLESGDRERAGEVLAVIDDSSYSDCTDLHLLAGVAEASKVLPDEQRALLIEYGWKPLLGLEVLDGPESTGAISRAIEHFEHCEKLALRDNAHTLQGQCKDWTRVLQLLSPTGKAAATARLIDSLKDGREAVRLARLAYAFNISFDTGPLEAFLARQALLGGLSDEEFFAQFELLKAKRPPEELTGFIEQEWERLCSISPHGAVAMEWIQALCRIGNGVKAQQVLDENRNDIGEDARRAELMIAQATGEDPTSAAIRLYKSTEKVIDLMNLVSGLEAGRKWGELAPYSLTLFDKVPSSANALRHAYALQGAKADPEKIVDFIESASHRIDLTPDLISLQAWSCYLMGDHIRAKALNDILMATRFNLNEFGLSVNLAVSLGDWDLIPEMLGKARQHQDDLTPEVLLCIARLAGFNAASEALELASKAISKNQEDPRILLAAYGVALSVGQEDSAAAWLNQAAELSKSSGPISKHSFRELVEYMRAQAEAWEAKNDKLRNGEIPVHFAATLFNRALIELIVNLPHSNRARPLARDRVPMPMWAGSRQATPIAPKTRLALDITSTYLLHSWGVFGLALDHFQEIHISPSFFEFLLRERQQVLFHQPSRIEVAKQFLAHLHQGRLRESSGLIRTADLFQEVDSETASFIAAAEADQGWFLCPRPIFRQSSYMEELADLGDHNASIVDIPELVAWLVTEGQLTEVKAEAALQALRRECFEGAPLQSPKALYLDGPSVQQLKHACIWAAILNLQIPVFIHANVVREWESLVGAEPRSAEMVTAIDSIRRSVRRQVDAGKVKFLKGPRRRLESEIGEMALLDLIAAVGKVDHVIVDDRFLTSMTMASEGGVTVPVGTSLDILESLVSAGKVSAEARDEIYHGLRESCVYCVPLTVDQLESALVRCTKDGVVKEAAELRVLRQYLARLHSVDVFRMDADLVYLDGLWRTAMRVIDRMWDNDAISVPDAEAMTRWIFENVVPCSEAAFAHATKDDDQKVTIAVQRAYLAVLAGFKYGNRARDYLRVVDETWLEEFLPGSTREFSRLIDQTGDLIVRLAEGRAIT